MSTPARQNFNIKANSTWVRTWQVLNNGGPYDITGYTFELEVKATKGPGTPIINLTVGNGITIVDAALGKIRLEIPPQSSITNTVTYYYDLIAIVSAKPYTWIEGTMTFEPGVSYV